MTVPATHDGISAPEQTMLEAIVISSVACCGAHIFALLLFFFTWPVSIISFWAVVDQSQRFQRVLQANDRSRDV